MEKKPCPFCGGTDLEIRWHWSHGHGDSGYSYLRVVCLGDECVATRGFSDYGVPDASEKQVVWDEWNKRV